MSGGGGSKGNGVASAPIPASSRKIIQSMKEIVNCPEQEIYAMLRECNMDPSEAIHRLLCQDTFHEVKSKREKKKETKETPESRFRAVNTSSNRGVRGGIDRAGRINSTQNSSSEYGNTRVKLVHKKENGTNIVPASLVVGSSTAGNNANRRATAASEALSVENSIHATGIADGPALPSQPSSGFQHNNWSRMPGHVSMADIVKMGRPQGKLSSTPPVGNDTSYSSNYPVISNMSNHNANRFPTTIMPSESNQELHTSQVPDSQVEEFGHELGAAVGEHSCDDWSLVDEAHEGSESAVLETSADEVNLHLDPQSEEIQVLEGHVNGESLLTESIRSISDRQKQVDNSGDSSHLDDGPLENVNYQSQMNDFEHYEVADVNAEISSAAANLQQLQLHKEELNAPSAENNPAVIIPDHLQVSNADFSHLSFGSFGSGMNATFSASFPSKPLQSNSAVTLVADDAPSLDQTDARNPEYYDNDPLKSTSNENVASRSSTSTMSYDIPSASQPEVVRDDTLDAARALQYNFPSVSSYAFSTTAQPNAAAYTYHQPNSQVQNLAPFSSLMQSYTNSLPSSLLAPTVQPHRELDLPLSALLTAQSMPTKYSTPASSSISGPTISMQEVKPGVFNTPQPAPQTLSSSSIPHGGPALSQHLPIHPYSQPALPLGHFANMISYPFLPQSYTFLPSAAFQQAYTGSGPFHQSPGAGIKYTTTQPQYKTSSLPPQSATVPSGYGGFGSSTNNIPGSFGLTPSTASVGTTSISFDDALSLQYKEGSHFLPLQQNESSAMWVHGAGSRAVSALPPSTFYGFQGQQNQLNSGFRQGQQQASPYGQMSYLNYYQSQAGGTSQEQHQQNNSEGNLSGSQGLPPSQQSPHQLWQHGY